MSYFDDQGLFWVTEQRALRGGDRVSAKDALRARLANMTFDGTYAPPPLHTPPHNAVVALDFETDDPDMMTKGPSWAFAGRGQVLGVALAWDNFDGYYGFAHSDGNVDEAMVIAFLAALRKRADITLVCANAVYDIGWLVRLFGMLPLCKIVDVQFMAALLDEYRLSYSLDAIAHSHLGAGKSTSVMNQIEKKLNVKHTDLMSCLRHLPTSIVGPYAVVDAKLTLDLYYKLLPKLEAEGLLAVHELESALIPMTTQMRRVGIRVDVDKAEQLRDELANTTLPDIKAQLKNLTGVDVEPWVGESCEKALNTIGVTCARTASGGPEVNAELLNNVAKRHPVGQLILDLRKASKILSTFVEGHVLGHQVNGRIHCEFNQLRSEREESGGFGTVTGRFSSTNPNLQQIPARDPHWGPIIRSLFLAEDGQQLASLDFKSQEPRLTVHFAALKQRYYEERGRYGIIVGALEAVQAFLENPNLDFHGYVAALCDIKRDLAKIINLGLTYGMGDATLAHKLGLPTQWIMLSQTGGRKRWIQIELEEVNERRQEGMVVVETAGPEAKAIIAKWEKNTPFMRGIFKDTMETAAERGFITTLLRRRCRFPMNSGYDWTRKALNRLIQSSAADQTKAGMLALWKENVTPLLTVHDELVFSVDSREQAESYAPYMIEATPLLVPVLVDIKLGKTWGDIPK